MVLIEHYQVIILRIPISFTAYVYIFFVLLVPAKSRKVDNPRQNQISN